MRTLTENPVLLFFCVFRTLVERKILKNISSLASDLSFFLFLCFPGGSKANHFPDVTQHCHQGLCSQTAWLGLLAQLLTNLVTWAELSNPSVLSYRWSRGDKKNRLQLRVFVRIKVINISRLRTVPGEESALIGIRRPGHPCCSWSVTGSNGPH